MSDSEFRTVVKADLGLTLRIPKAWEEWPPDLRNSLNEVARFVKGSQGPTVCVVFWNPNPDDKTTRQVAELAEKHLQARFQNFAFQEITFAGRKGTRLECDGKTRRGSLWSLWEHFVNVEGHTSCFALGTFDIERDRELFEQMADTIKLSEPATSGSLSEMALVRYSTPARKVIARSGRIAQALGEDTLCPKHLIYSLALTLGDDAPVMLNALGVTQVKLPIPEIAEDEADSGSEISVGEDLYKLLTREAPKVAASMAASTVRPGDILSAMVSSMPESVRALGK